MTEPIRQSLLVAATLIDEYDVVLRRFVDAWRQDLDMDLHRADLERVYAGIWENLDVAAKGTRAAGRDTAAFDAARGTAGRGPAIQKIKESLVGSREVRKGTEYTFRLEVVDDASGRAAARTCAAALRAAWPELDFTPAPPVDVDLRPGGIGGLFARLFGKKSSR